MHHRDVRVLLALENYDDADAAITRTRVLLSCSQQQRKLSPRQTDTQTAYRLLYLDYKAVDKQ